MCGSTADTRPLALLIPGLDGTGSLYHRQIGPLSRTHRVLAWHYGDSPDFKLSDLTGELWRETAAEPPRSVLVVGESFGGLVALDYTLTHPEQARRLLLVNAFPYYGRRIRIRLARILAPLVEIRAAQWARIQFQLLVLRCEGIPAEERRHFGEVVLRIRLAPYRRRLELIETVDLRPQLPRISVPTVLLAARRDKLVPSVREARYMASRIPSARVHVFPRAGHALLLTPGFSLADYALEDP
jgi:pimeloyl-ACP methyl ester carboxylesterase